MLCPSWVRKQLYRVGQSGTQWGRRPDRDAQTIFALVLVNVRFRRWWRVLDSNQCSLRDGFTARCADSNAPRLTCGNAEAVIWCRRSRPPFVRSSRVAPVSVALRVGVCRRGRNWWPGEARLDRRHRHGQWGGRLPHADGVFGLAGIRQRSSCTMFSTSSPRSGKAAPFGVCWFRHRE
jgi:hypothetical protein